MALSKLRLHPRHAALAVVVLALTTVFVAGTDRGHAGHVDSSYVFAPRVWYYFFDDYPSASQVKWQPCDPWLGVFGLTANATSATIDWENTHGYGIDYYNNGSCSGVPLAFLTFRSHDQCGVPPPNGVFLGCWYPFVSTTIPDSWSLVGGCCLAAQYAAIWINTLWIDAYGFTEAQQTWVFAHELGHAMAIAHHDNCTTVMSEAGPCTNQVEQSDVFIPRCMYAYTC